MCESCRKQNNRLTAGGSISLEDPKQTGASSAISGEQTMMNGTKFQDRVLDRNNLNQAYLRVKRNKESRRS